MKNMLTTLIDAMKLLESCKEDDANKARVLVNDAEETVREMDLLSSVPWFRFAAAHQALYGINPSASSPYLGRYQLWS